jgi:hypothetical protein
VGALARHARRCEACREYADGVALVRGWLERRAAHGPSLFDAAVSATSVLRRAQAAVARELASRLARDLAAVARGGFPRAERFWRADLRRLVALRDSSPLRPPPWPAVTEVLARSGASTSDRAAEPGVGQRLPGSAERAEALRLAARLDPLGLDVALGHLALLERTGCGEQADAEADRLLAML